MLSFHQRFNDFNDFVNDGPQEKVCWDCYSIGEKIFEPLGLTVHLYSDFVNQKDKVEINHYSARDIKLLEGGSPNASSYRLAEGFNVYFSDNDVDWTGVGTAYDVTYQVSGGGEGCYAVSAFDSSPEYESDLSDSYCVDAPECSLSGDSNGDGSVNVADIVALVNQILYSGGAVGDYLCGDGDNNGSINKSNLSIKKKSVEVEVPKLKVLERETPEKPRKLKKI